MKKYLWIAGIIILTVWGGRALFGGGDSKATTTNETPRTYTKSQTICLDPGHGGDDPGAVNGSLTEANVNLQVALKVREALWKQGYRVYMTRVVDRWLENADRYNFCNARNATILVSIHQNYFDDNTVDHTTALWYKDVDVELADTLAEATGAALSLDVTPTTEFDGGVLMKSHMPATIVEGLFITNASDATSIKKSDKLLTKQAAGITRGITTYFAAQAKPTP